MTMKERDLEQVYIDGIVCQMIIVNAIMQYCFYLLNQTSIVQEVTVNSTTFNIRTTFERYIYASGSEDHQYNYWYIFGYLFIWVSFHSLRLLTNENNP